MDALRPVVERLAGAWVARGAIPGLIVGVSHRGRRSYFGFNGAGGAPYRSDTIVEIGSITKVFTTALFAEAVDAGRLRPDTPLQELLPNLRLRPCTAQITPLQLANFTSGMPTLPGDLPRALAERSVRTYPPEAFLAWVSRWSPEGSEAGGCALPAPYRYSNAGIGLLGYVLSERLGAPWESLVHERITGPLGMTSTAVTVKPADRARLAQGYGMEGQPVMPWPVFAWYAAGALRSTATDMLAFGEAALGHEAVNGAPVPPALTRALRKAMTPLYQPEGQTFRQGMAWIEEIGDPDAGQRPVFLKVGGTDGFNSVVVVNPGKDLVVFVAGGQPKIGAERLGVALSRQIR
ncbi:serine hydrolase domain-containing protein [Methylobacterium oryzae]|uniref:serine hydrolase domain-containing protein n=1 Tax=Methylobacterium oryzae TaxID=334852 RepID=UPI002F2E3098